MTIFFFYFFVAFGFAARMNTKYGFTFWRSFWEGIGWPWWLGSLICKHYYDIDRGEK